MNLQCSKDKFNTRFAQIQVALLQRDLEGVCALKLKTITGSLFFYLHPYFIFEIFINFIKDEWHLLRRYLSTYYLITIFAFGWADYVAVF